MANGIPQLGAGGVQAFQVGQQLAGPSALGVLARDLTKRLQQMQQVRAAAQTKIDVAGKIKGAELQAEEDFFGGGTPGAGEEGIVTKRTIGSRTIEFPEAQADLAAQKEQASKAQEVKVITQDVENLTRNMISSFKSLRREAGGAGRVVGLKSAVTKKLGEKTPSFLRGPSGEANPDVVAFEGQRTETATAIAKMITGTARPAFALIQQLKGTLPTTFSTDREAATQVRNTIRNAVARKLAREGRKLGPAELVEVDALIDDVLATPAARPVGLGNDNETATEDIDAELRRRGLI